MFLSAAFLLHSQFAVSYIILSFKVCSYFKVCVHKFLSYIILLLK